MRLGIITDIHLSPAGTPPGRWHNPLHYDRADEWLDRAIRNLEDRDVDAIAVLGDLSNFGDAESISRGIEALGRVEVPVYIVAGNHDGLTSPELWRSTIKSSGKDNISIPNGELVGSYPVRLAGIGDVHVSADGHVWNIPADSVTAPGDEALVLLTHFPLISREAEILAAGLKFAGGFHWASTGEFLMSRTAPTIVAHGHLHIRHSVIDGPILQLGFAGLIEPPHSVGLIEIDVEGEDIVVVVEHDDVDTYDVEIVPVLSPAKASWRFSNGTWLEP